MEPADASRVLLDCSEGCIERKVRPMPHAAHGIQSMAGGVNRKLLIGCLCNASHRAAEQIGQVPCLAIVCWGHDYVQASPQSWFVQEHSSYRMSHEDREPLMAMAARIGS